MPLPRSDIPVGTQFAPTLIDLRAFLKAAFAADGDLDVLKAAIWQSPVYVRERSTTPTRRGSNLPIEAAVQYELLDRETKRPTQLALDLAELEPPEVYDAFARHIYNRLNGYKMIEACKEMLADGRSITGDELAVYLTEHHALTVTEHNTAINSMRLWLAQAGIFPASGANLWRVNEENLDRVLGLSGGAIASLAALTEDQRAFALALCAIDPADWYLASSVRELAEVRSGLRLGRSSLPNQYLKPLQAAGLIEYQSGGTAGGKAARLRTTEAFKADLLQPFLEYATKDVDAALVAYYLVKPADIYKDLKSKDTFVAGKALEAYTVHVMRLLGLRFMGWRKRGTETGGAEVDALLAGVFGGVPTRWQIQCKNTPSQKVDLEDVAKEIGLLPLSNATHILLLANAKLTEAARTFADAIMRARPVAVYLLDENDFAQIQKEPAVLATILRSRAKTILRDPPVGSLWSS
jgi:hypothetical protein